VVSDSAAHIVNTWNASTQNITHVMNALSMVGVPPRTSNSEQSVIHGLRAAIEGLAEPTDFQKEVLLNSKNANSNQLVNKGRVICITSARDDSSMNSLSDIFLTVLVQQNKISAAHSDLLTIDFCHLVIINLYPKNIESFVSNRSIQDVSRR
jgi:Cell cycle and development regulator